jgi:hypothetical protein
MGSSGGGVGRSTGSAARQIDLASLPDESSSRMSSSSARRSGGSGMASDTSPNGLSRADIETLLSNPEMLEDMGIEPEFLIAEAEALGISFDDPDDASGGGSGSMPHSSASAGNRGLDSDSSFPWDQPSSSASVPPQSQSSPSRQQQSHAPPSYQPSSSTTAPSQKSPEDAFAAIVKEKMTLSARLQRWARDPSPMFRNLNISPMTTAYHIDDLRNEVKRVEFHLNMERSIDIQEKLFIILGYGAEKFTGAMDYYLNTNLNLKGWGDVLQKQAKHPRFREIFEEFYDENFEAFQWGPKARMAYFLLTSAFEFRLQQAFVKALRIPNAEAVLENHPQLREDIMKAAYDDMRKSMGVSSGSVSSSNIQYQPPAPPTYNTATAAAVSPSALQQHVSAPVNYTTPEAFFPPPPPPPVILADSVPSAPMAYTPVTAPVRQSSSSSSAGPNLSSLLQETRSQRSQRSHRSSSGTARKSSGASTSSSRHGSSSGSKATHDVMSLLRSVDAMKSSSSHKRRR